MSGSTTAAIVGDAMTVSHFSTCRDCRSLVLLRQLGDSFDYFDSSESPATSTFLSGLFKSLTLKELMSIEFTFRHPTQMARSIEEEDQLRVITQEEIRALGYEKRPRLKRAISTLTPYVHSTVFPPPVDLSEPQCAICFQTYANGQAIMAFQGCKHYLHASCMIYFLNTTQRCHQCFAAVFDKETMWQVKEEAKHYDAVKQLTGLENRPNVREALMLTDFRLLSSRFVPRYGAWQGAHCLTCSDDYIEEDAVLIFRCGHFMHFSCATEMMSRMGRYKCVECETSFWPREIHKAIFIEGYRLVAKKKFAQESRLLAQRMARSYVMGYDPATRFLGGLALQASMKAQRALETRDRNALGWLRAEYRYREEAELAERQWAWHELPHVFDNPEDHQVRTKAEWPPSADWVGLPAKVWPYRPRQTVTFNLSQMTVTFYLRAPDE
ncbi:hypothetical protein NA57DRAFT_76601 [Rhizodiscina lignyota]|uniref:RING-type domain-containing protein n=1 Tax=Rhizodiscina lignyota TaxID=1504668 RepID=A0A9P4IDR6_9PEZI|nr:hypothetical protein NA57DRAFT_76601 [Rhizodiscina lignyota]